MHGIVEDHDCVEHYQKSVNADQGELSNAGPVFLHSLRRKYWVTQHSIGLVPLDQKYEGNYAKKKIGPIRDKTIPHPAVRGPMIHGNAPDERSHPNGLYQGDSHHDCHAVEVLVHFAFDNNDNVGCHYQREQNAHDYFDGHASWQLIIWIASILHLLFTHLLEFYIYLE